MSTMVTDEQIQQLAATAKPFSVALLHWTADRHMDGAAVTELEHQRRLVSLRADGVIAILCPVVSETLAGVVIMTVSPDEARTVMGDDPCVQAGMMTCEVYSAAGFPGDSLPA
jgi:hypothetical protein